MTNKTKEEITDKETFDILYTLFRAVPFSGKAKNGKTANLNQLEYITNMLSSKYTNRTIVHWDISMQQLINTGYIEILLFELKDVIDKSYILTDKGKEWYKKYNEKQKSILSLINNMSNKTKEEITDNDILTFINFIINFYDCEESDFYNDIRIDEYLSNHIPVYINPISIYEFINKFIKYTKNKYDFAKAKKIFDIAIRGSQLFTFDVVRNSRFDIQPFTFIYSLDISEKGIDFIRNKIYEDSNYLEKIKSIKNHRTVESSILYAMTEIGELSDEILKDKGLSNKDKQENGVIYEAVDVIVSCLDIIQLAKPDITIKEIEQMIHEKVDKWKAKNYN